MSGVEWNEQGQGYPAKCENFTVFYSPTKQWLPTY